MSKYFVLFQNFSFVEFLDIVVVAVLIYYLYLVAAKTRALPVLYGFVLILALTFLSSFVGLDTLHNILQNFVSIMAFSFIILFPEEIRKVLYGLGQKIFLNNLIEKESYNKKAFISAIVELKKKKLGALFILKKEQSLDDLIEGGTVIDSNIDTNLIITLFLKDSLLHDGAVVIENDRIKAAACYIPHLSSNHKLNKKLGTRHRAALGFSEQSDALMIIVSEETGQVSLAENSVLVHNISIDKLKRELTKRYWKKRLNNNKFHFKQGRYKAFWQKWQKNIFEIFFSSFPKKNKK